MNYPLRRTTGLLVEEVAGEAIIYDERSHRAHCLNATAATVWRHCDGRTSIGEIATAISAGLSSPVDPGVVRLAVHELGESGLLEGHPAVSGAAESRREALRKMAAAGGAVALVPVITSIVAPTPAMAQSGDYHGGGDPGDGGGYGGGGEDSGGGGGSKPGRGHGDPGRAHGKSGDEHGNSAWGRGNSAVHRRDGDEGRGHDNSGGGSGGH